MYPRRYEGQTYAYCTVITWTVLVELETIVVNSYFPLVAAVIINAESTGLAINDASVIILAFQFIPDLQARAHDVRTLSHPPRDLRERGSREPLTRVLLEYTL